MFKKSLIIFIIILLITYYLYNQDNYNNIQENYENSNDILLNESNFQMNNKSIVRSMTTDLSKDECFNKLTKADINGVSFNNKTNECRTYFFAEKGAPNIDYESLIYV